MTATRTPILPGDIRNRDRIRCEYSIEGDPVAHEYIASFDANSWDERGTHYLLKRPVPPVVLPDVPGWYVGRADLPNYAHLQLCDEECHGETAPHWYRPDQRRVIPAEEVAEHYLPLTRLRPESEVAAEFATGLLEFFDRVGGGLTTHENDVALFVAERYGVTL